MADPAVTFLVNLLRAGALVFLTYNPTPWSFLTALAANPMLPASLVLLGGLCLLLGLAHLLKQCLASFGLLTLSLVFAICLCALWAVIDLRIVSISPADTWLLLSALIVTLAIGASWPEWQRQRRLRWHQRRGDPVGAWLTGQTKNHSKK